jgi:hypothetical protein
MKMEELVKIAIYVPVDHAGEIRRVLGEVGAGKIGNYDFCSFSVRGIGRFKPGKGSDPFSGEQGTIERVEEERIETVCPKKIARDVIEAVRNVHPYDEMAFDVYPLLNHESI